LYEPHFRLRQQKSQRGFRTLVLVAPVRVQPIAAAAALAGVEFQPQIVPAKEPVEGPLRLSVPPWVGRGTVCFQARRNRGLRLDRLLVELRACAVAPIESIASYGAQLALPEVCTPTSQRNACSPRSYTLLCRVARPLTISACASFALS